MDKEVGEIKQESFRLCWYMRGGLTYDVAMQLSNDERKLIGEIVREHMETTKKTGLNFF
jgi:hypothetical protein